MCLPPCLKRIRDIEHETASSLASVNVTHIETSLCGNSSHYKPMFSDFKESRTLSRNVPKLQSYSSKTVPREKSSCKTKPHNTFTSGSMTTEQVRPKKKVRRDEIYQTMCAALIVIQCCGEFQCETCIARSMGLECGEPWLGIETMDRAHQSKRLTTLKSLHRGPDIIEFISKGIYPEYPGVNLIQVLKRDDIIAGGSDPIIKLGSDETERDIRIHYGNCKRIFNLSCSHARLTLHGLAFFAATAVYRGLVGASTQDPSDDSIERIRNTRLLGVRRIGVGVWTAEVEFVA